MKRILVTILVLVFLINSSCIHTDSIDRNSLVIENKKNLVNESADAYVVKSIVYSKSVLPLEIFFQKLVNGQVKEALRKISLSYKDKNTDSQILLEIMKMGYIPAYVEIENKSNETIKVKYNNFVLKNDQSLSAAIDSKIIPREIKKFSPSALAANVWNITVGTIGLISVAVILGYLRINHFPGKASDLNKEFDANLNSLVKTTKLDYTNLLITEYELKPKVVISGLVFFKLDSNYENSNFEIIYTQD